MVVVCPSRWVLPCMLHCYRLGAISVNDHGHFDSPPHPLPHTHTFNRLIVKKTSPHACMLLLYIFLHPLVHHAPAVALQDTTAKVEVCSGALFCKFTYLWPRFPRRLITTIHNLVSGYVTDCGKCPKQNMSKRKAEHTGSMYRCVSCGGRAFIKSDKK